MEQDNIEIKSEVKHKTGKGVKAALVVLSLLTIISISGLVYLMFSSNSQKNQLESQVKSAKEELAKANETVSKYEAATGTKAVEEKIENTTVKEIVRPMRIDTKIGEIEEIVKREYIKQTGLNDDGLQIKNSWPTVSFDALYTTNDAKYLIARVGIRQMFEVAKSDREGDTRVESGWGGSTAIFYRPIPSGEWKKAYEGNGIPTCDSFSEEIKNALGNQKDLEGKSILFCWDQNKTENNGIVSL